jgi:hypothetical protein
VAGRRRRVTVFSIFAAAVAAIVLVTLASRVPFSSNTLRSRVVATLAERLDAEVELGNVWLRIAPNLHAEGEGLIIRHRGRRDVPPLISVKNVVIDADLIGLWNRRVARVRLDGLEIMIPPGGVDIDGTDTERRVPKDPADVTPDKQVATSGSELSKPNASPAGDAALVRSKKAPDHDDDTSFEREVVIDDVIADQATLTIMRRNPQKKPRVWLMHELHVQQVGARTAMPFRTYLTNAVPPGQIDTTGAFGPWNREDPGSTPLEGAFTFENADLGTFKGIEGILSAAGTYEGSLERIEVVGKTDTPDFVVKVGGHKVPLKTTYHATVDGTNGNTTLEKIEATFLKTSLVAHGGVYDVEGVKGRIVTLDVEMRTGRIEDVMKLAVKSAQPPMTGNLRLNTKLELPPGDDDVVEKLRLDGAFTIDDGRFASQDVQQKINELSHRARGRKLDEPRTKVGSEFTGRFKLTGGTLTLAKLTFDVPGAIIELGGDYRLKPETMDFKGNLFMDARVSETVSGWKSVMLKVVDPLFRKKGRTVIPITIGGSRSQPQFGLDAKRVF